MNAGIWIVVGIACGFLAFQVAVIVPAIAFDSPPVVAFFAASALSNLLALGLIAAIVLRRVRAPHVPPFALFAATVPLWPSSLAAFLALEAPSMPAWPEWLLVGASPFGAAFLAPWLSLGGFLRFSALFPNSLQDLGAARPVLWWGPLRGVDWARWREMTTRPGSVWWRATALGLVCGAPFAAIVVGARDSGGSFALLVFTFVGTPILLALLSYPGLLNLRSAYRAGGPAARKTLGWLYFSIVAPFWLGVLGLAAWLALPDPWGNVAAWAGVAAPLPLLVGLWFATFYAGALDPRLLISRTSLVGVLGAVLLFLFSGLENVASSLIEDRLGLPGYVSALVAGGLAALLALPLRAQFQQVAARLTPKDSLSGGEVPPSPQRSPCRSPRGPSD